MRTTHPEETWEGFGMQYFPGFSVRFLSDAGHLIPVDRGIIRSGERRRSPWNIIVSPGRVWREPGDGGLSRGSFPFTLTTNGVGQARNGLATFVYDETSISSVFIQITQETSPASEYSRDDFSAFVPATYAPHAVPDRDAVLEGFHQEVERRLPVLPWSSLEDAEAVRRLFNKRMKGADLSAAAVLVDGKLYVQDSPTRTGPYPYPESMRHGVFSVTKTLGVGLAMFYLAGRYGDEIFDFEISDYVPALAEHPGWKGVTFSHALNMVVGTQCGDTGIWLYPMILARTPWSKLDFIRRLPDDDPAPGEAFKYSSSHTFVLSYAMNQLVKRREGADADYWALVEEEVLKPLGIRHLAIQRAMEADGTPGPPTMGWGTYPTVDEATKIAVLLRNEGTHEGRQLLSRRRVREALGATEWPGVEERYRHSVWHEKVEVDGRTLTVHCMSGHGGNFVALLPSGVVMIRFGDSEDYDLQPMVRAMRRLRP
jgi:CubicO group peptidase (beta-lactamase class C family)